jgi:deoxyribodipyrimidine photo-lyase
MTVVPTRSDPVAITLDFADRAALRQHLTDLFPDAAARDDRLAEWRGGADAAKERLRAIDPVAYGHTRNHLDGKVSRLSPYIRHGVVELPDVRDLALDKVSDPKQALKFIQELAWRDYWLRVYDEIGEGVWEDREVYKTGFSHDDYATDLPEEISGGTTGLTCIDSWSRDLLTTGYLHNHVRMYVAAYVVHWRRVRWQAGAEWFLIHLLDGDPASNNLSWQWVASSFGHKPYIFNRDNLVKYTDGKYCADCPHATAGTCPFDASYDVLADRLFPYGQGQ